MATIGLLIVLAAWEPSQVQCTAIRAYVAQVGRAEAERKARDHGWTDEEIATARKRCLRS